MTSLSPYYRCTKWLPPCFMGIFLICFGTTETVAQENEDYILVAHYTDENGLPQNSVKGMALQDDYLWMATENGLVRFDGHHFINYTGNNIKGLNGNRMMGISRGPHDTLYVFTEDKKVISVKQYPRHVSPYDRKRHGDSWCVDPTLPKWPPGKIPEKEIPASYQIYITIYDTLHQKAFLCYEQQVAWYENRQLQAVTTMPPGFKRNLVFRINQKIYYLHDNWELYEVQPGSLTKVTSFYKKNSMPPLGHLEDESGHHYFLTTEGVYELWITGPSQARLRLLTRSVAYHNLIYNILTKDDGTLVIGTLNKGLYILRKASFRTVGNDMISLEKGLSVFYAQTLLPDRQHVFTAYGTYFDTAGTAFTNPVLREQDVRSFYTDAQGYTWYADTGILFKQLLPGGPRIPVMPLDGILKILYRTSDSLLWICTTRTVGYLRDGKYRSIVAGQPASDSLMGEVGYMTEEKNGDLLIGSTKGLFRYVHTTGSFQLIPGTGNHVRFIKVEQPGKIWFTTYGYGFGLIEHDKVIRFPTDGNHYLLFSHSIIEDRKGFFWIPTNKGIFQMARRDLEAWAQNNTLPVPYYHYYNVSDGFKTNEFNGGCFPAFIQLPNGQYSIPSMNGLVWFDPEKIRPELPDQPLSLSSAAINGSTEIDISAPIVLPRRYNEIRFSFSSPNWGNAENEYREYRLLGNNTHHAWQPIGREKEVVIGQLEGGHYILEVRKKGGFGLNNFKTCMVPFRVEKLFTETALFYILLLLALIGLMWLVSLLRTRLLHRQKLQLQQQVKERTRQLEESNYIKNKLISILSHDITTPLQFISLISGHLQKFPAQSPEELQGNLKKIAYSSEQLMTLADDLLRWMKTQDGQVTLTMQRISLRNLVEEKYSFFAPLAEDQKITLDNFVADTATCFSDRCLLAIIIHNIISNAVKFTMRGSVSISSVEQFDHIHLIIQDTGIGMSEEKLESIRNKMGHAGGTKTTKLVGKGIGLMIIDDLARLLNIKIEYDSEKGRGTTVTLIISNQLFMRTIAYDAAVR